MIAPARVAAKMPATKTPVPETPIRETGPRRAASAALMPLAEAVARLTEHRVPVAPRALPIAEALSRIAAADIVAPRAAPSTATALRDGWAAPADAVLGAAPHSPILLLHPLTWVDAGATMPEGTDAVLPPEAIEGRNVIADAAPGAGRRGVGEEFGAGTVLIRRGARITPLGRIALQSAGIAELPVRSPRLRLVVTGADDDTLSPLVAAMAQAEGATVTAVIRVADEPDAIAGAIREPEADAVLVLGGTGYGRDDRSAEGLARAGIVQGHGIALRPGETAGFGEAGGRPVLLLPGRPDAALGAFLALGRPLVAALSGASTAVAWRAPLLRKVTSTIGFDEVVFARREPAGLMPLGGADLPLHRLIEADAAILLAAGAEGHPAGTPVEALLL